MKKTWCNLYPHNYTSIMKYRIANTSSKVHLSIIHCHCCEYLLKIIYIYIYIYIQKMSHQWHTREVPGLTTVPNPLPVIFLNRLSKFLSTTFKQIWPVTKREWMSLNWPEFCIYVHFGNASIIREKYISVYFFLTTFNVSYVHWNNLSLWYSIYKYLFFKDSQQMFLKNHLVKKVEWILRENLTVQSSWA